MNQPTTFATIPPWLHEFRALALALLDEDGRLVESNEGFLFTLGEPGGESAAARFVEPTFGRLLQSPPAGDGLVYRGMITLSVGEGITRAFSGKVYRFGRQLLLAAELDVTAFEKLSLDNEHMRRELEETKRQLLRRNQLLQKTQLEMEDLRRQDGLTGLANSRQLDARLDEERLRWERYHRPLALIFLDLDDFAAINREYGRETGDEILKHVGTILKDSLRSLDLVARYGGQEFAALLPETNEMGAMIVAERLRMDLESQLILPLLRPLTASFGVAMLLPQEKREDFYGRAERALRHAKANGRNCVTMAGVIAECDYIYQGNGHV